MSFAVLFVNVLTLTFSIYSGTTLADEKTFTTFFSDNYSSNHTGNRRNAAISQNPAIDGADRFTGGCLGGLNYWGDFNSSMDWRYRIQSNELWAAGNSESHQNVPNTFIGPDYSFGSNLGITTITEEGGTRTYRLSFDVRNPSSTWAGIQLGLSANQRGSYITSSSGIGFLMTPSGGFELFDNSSSPKLSGNYTYQATNHVVVEYEMAGFTSANKATVNIYVDGNQIVSNYITTTGFSDNYFQLISRSTGNTSLVVYYDNLVVESTANTVLDVSNPLISLSREWQINGLDKQGIEFLSNRSDSSEAEHTGNLVLSNNGGFIDVASGLTLLQSGDITGQYTLTKTGEGTLELTAANTYDGGTTISDGTLKLSGAGTLGTGAVTVGENATLEIAYDNPNTSVNISSISMADGDVFNEGSAFKVPSGTVTFGTTDVALNNLSGGEFENGQITVPSSLTVAGKLTLNNDQLTKFIGSITAPTVEKTGLDTLQLCFDAQNAVSIGSLVVSSGRVDLKGYMQGGITVDANGVFSPGNSVGEAKFGGGYELYDGAKLLIEMDETGVDSLIASSFNETNGIIELAIDGIPFGSHYDVITATNGFSGTQDEAYWLGKFGTLPDYMTRSVVDGVYGANSQTVRFSIDRNAVPEPSTWALLILGAAGLLYVRKRTRK